MFERYDMVWEVGTDIRRQFNFDANALNYDRGLLDHDFKMQVRVTDNPTARVIYELSKDAGTIYAGHSRIILHIEDNATFDLTGCELGYITEPVPSADEPTTIYAPFAYYDLKSYAPDGTVNRELKGKIGFSGIITADTINTDTAGA